MTTSHDAFHGGVCLFFLNLVQLSIPVSAFNMNKIVLFPPHGKNMDFNFHLINVFLEISGIKCAFGHI